MTKASDALLGHVKTLATRAGRLPGTPGHQRARRYLCAALEHLKAAPYDGATYEMSVGVGENELINILAVAPGKDRCAAPILLAAHYDTFGKMPGADDNAAAVAIVLEIGRSLMRFPAECDVILAFFDGEELGCKSMDSIGSVKFYKNQCKTPVRCAFALDLVGHDVPVDGLEDIIIVTGMESSRSWSKILKQAEPDREVRWATVLDSYEGSLSDHYIYAQNKEPFLFFSCGRWEHYHQPSDTYDNLNYLKMAKFKKALLEIIRAAADSKPKPGFYDSAGDEAHFLNKNLLPALGVSGFKLRSREDIDRLVAMMISQFSL